MPDKNLAPQTVHSFPSLELEEVFDVIIIGGGPAGLSAALILGRCRRKVVVVDAGEPRNRWSRSMHGYLSRDGVAPADMAAMSREQLKAYPTVRIQAGRAIDAMRTDDGRFIAVLENGTRFMSRYMLLATGVVDVIPDIPGLLELYGTSVHHCPYCDGFEWSDRAIAVYGKGQCGFGLVQELTAWSRDLLLCTDGPVEFDIGRRDYLECMRIKVCEKRIVGLDAMDGKLASIRFADGSSTARDALFFCTGQSLGGGLAQKLGCRITEQGCVWTGNGEATNIPGLYCAGDATRNAQLVIVAAAEGAQAAVSINKALTGEYKEAKQARTVVQKPDLVQ